MDTFEGNIQYLPTDTEINTFLGKCIEEAYSDDSFKIHKNGTVIVRNSLSNKHHSTTILELVQRCAITYTGKVIRANNTSEEQDIVAYLEGYYDLRTIYNSIVHRREIALKVLEIMADRNTATLFLKKLKNKSVRNLQIEIKKLQT